jgi:hypothetical protein
MTRMFGHGRYASVTATLALVVALGGTSYAAVALPKNSVGTAQIKKSGVANSDIRANAVTSDKVKLDTLTGADINEAQLGTVPKASIAGVAGSATNATNAVNAVNATNADKATTATSATNATNATNAANADKVGGQTVAKINYQAASVAAASTVFDAGGLKITAACASGGELSLNATTTKAGSSIYTFAGGDGSPTANDPVEDDLEDGAFGTASTFDLLAGGAANIELLHFEFTATDGTSASGLIVADETGSTCTATGHVTVG